MESLSKILIPSLFCSLIIIGSSCNRYRKPFPSKLKLNCFLLFLFTNSASLKLLYIHLKCLPKSQQYILIHSYKTFFHYINSICKNINQHKNLKTAAVSSQFFSHPLQFPESSYKYLYFL